MAITALHFTVAQQQCLHLCLFSFTAKQATTRERDAELSDLNRSRRHRAAYHAEFHYSVATRAEPTLCSLWNLQRHSSSSDEPDTGTPLRRRSPTPRHRWELWWRWSRQGNSTLAPHLYTQTTHTVIWSIQCPGLLGQAVTNTNARLTKLQPELLASVDCWLLSAFKTTCWLLNKQS